MCSLRFPRHAVRSSYTLGIHGFNLLRFFSGLLRLSYGIWSAIEMNGVILYPTLETSFTEGCLAITPIFLTIFTGSLEPMEPMVDPSLGKKVVIRWTTQWYIAVLVSGSSVCWLGSYTATNRRCR